MSSRSLDRRTGERLMLVSRSIVRQIADVFVGTSPDKLRAFGEFCCSCTWSIFMLMIAIRFCLFPTPGLFESTMPALLIALVQIGRRIRSR